MKRDRNHKNGRFRRTETSSYKMTKHDGFDAVSWQAFQEAATEKYDFASSACPKGEKMVFGKCQKVGESKGTEVAKTQLQKDVKKLSTDRDRDRHLKSKSAAEKANAKRRGKPSSGKPGKITSGLDYAACGQGEKMVFGKCAKVGGSGKKEVPDSLRKAKTTVEAELASAKKRGNKNQIRKAEAKLKSVNAKIDSYNASEESEFASSGCPDGFRSKGSQTINGKRREVCCSPDGKTCITSDGIPL